MDSNQTNQNFHCLNDFHDTVECSQPLRFIVTGASYNIPDILPITAKENHQQKPIICSEESKNIEIRAFGTEKSSLFQNKTDLESDAKLNIGNDLVNVTDSNPLKTIPTPLCVNETTTDKVDDVIKMQPKKAKKSICVFSDRNMELHKIRLDVEKKRIKLLELKLTREREEIMHERVKFERDLEYKELVIKQIKEESSIV